MGNTYHFLKNESSILDGVKCFKFKRDFKKEHPSYFDPEGLLIFCGSQGSGKTLSAVTYCRNILEQYPKCKFVTNVEFLEPLPHDIEPIPYTGLDCLSEISNGYDGVLYLIDEIMLEFNSLESKNITVEEMIEFAQQRKQRKHIVGTSQVYGRIAKPLREQIKYAVLCKNYLGVLQRNRLIDGFNTQEKNGKLVTDCKKQFFWFHSPKFYKMYNTYAKMGRTKQEGFGGKI